MDDHTVELACDALYEFFKAGTWNPNSKKGHAVRTVMRHMEKMRGTAPAPAQNMLKELPADDAAQDFSTPACAESFRVPADNVRQPEDALAAARQETQELRRQLEHTKADMRQAVQEAEASKRKEKQAEQALRDAEQRHRDALEKAQAAARNAESRAAQAERQREAERRSQLPDQAVLAEVQRFLDGLSPELKSIVAQYFDTGSLTTFLVQCGQFNRLNQLWEACGKDVTAGRRAPDMADGLKRLLKLYNRAAGESPATLVEPAPGDAYKSAIHYRVASDGSVISKMLLPGLRNAGGKVQQNALVELR